MRLLNFATFNIRGLRKIFNNEGSPTGTDLTNIITDLKKHNIDAAAIQETHYKEAEILQKEPGYTCYFVNEENNRHHGTGILVKDSLNPIFSKISGRVCTARFQLTPQKEVLFICGYAPHETLSNQLPEERETFYTHLQKALKQRKCNTIPIIALDANAQTTHENQEIPSNILGKFTKGKKTNNNGIKFLQFAQENDMSITNTMFQHKMSRRTTWTAPFRAYTINGQPRKNPIHNQIDYILIDKKYSRFVTNARSYNNTTTISDHNMVIMNFKAEFSKINRPKTDKPSPINTANFRDKKLNEEYRQKVNKEYNNKETNDNNDRWQRVVDTCLKVGEEVLGKNERTKTCQDKEIIRLSEMRQTIKRQILDSEKPEKIEKLKLESKYVKKEIDRRLRKKEEEEVNKKMEHLEAIKDDNTKYHYVMRDINKPTHKVPILVKDENGDVPGSTAGKIAEIERYFKKTLSPPHMENEFLNVPPTKMTKKFTAFEIQRIAKRLGNDKAAGPDKLAAEFIKNAPLVIHEEIATIYNITAETGDVPTAMIHGLLCPLQKPGKKKAPLKTLGPSSC